MNCYDCATHDSATTAVAVCHDCGAGVCTDHAVATAHLLTRTVPLGRRIPIEPAARIVRCTTCAAADTAVRSPDTGQSRAEPVPDRSMRRHSVH